MANSQESRDSAPNNSALIVRDPRSPEFEQTASYMAREFAETTAEIKRLLLALNAATERLDAAFRTDADVDYPWNRFRIDMEYQGDRRITPDDLVKAMERKAWDVLVDVLGIKNIMSVAQRNAFEEQLSRGKLPPVSDQSIVGILLGFTNQATKFAREAAVEVFDLLRPRGHRGRQYVSNSAFRVGRRVVLPWMVEQRYGGDGFRVIYRSEPQITALDGVFHMLDGKGMMRENKGPLVKAIAETDETGRGETTYFKFKCCKNRNLHIEFKRPDLVQRLNGVAVGEYVLGEDGD